MWNNSNEIAITLVKNIQKTSRIIFLTAHHRLWTSKTRGVRCHEEEFMRGYGQTRTILPTCWSWTGIADGIFQWKQLGNRIIELMEYIACTACSSLYDAMNKYLAKCWFIYFSIVPGRLIHYFTSRHSRSMLGVWTVGSLGSMKFLEWLTMLWPYPIIPTNCDKLSMNRDIFLIPVLCIS